MAETDTPLVSIEEKQTEDGESSVDTHEGAIQEVEPEEPPKSKLQDLGIPGDLMELLEAKWSEVEEDAVQLLQNLIQIDTRNFGDDGTEIEAVKLIKEKFDEVGITYEIVEPKAGRGNIIARIPGDGSSDKGPLLLNSHLDTVRAPREKWEEEGWKHDPFGGVIDEEDGCLYGRGAVDMKNMAAMCVAIFRFVKKNNIVLSRDLIFAGVADEERSESAWGAKYLVNNRPELVEADVVFSEVGGFSMQLIGREVFPIQIAEKGMARIKITAHGPGGHGSLFHKVNPIATIGVVAQKLHTYHLPLRVNVANRATIESMAGIMSFPVSTLFRQVLNSSVSSFIRKRFLTEDQESSIGPLLHNTANPVLVEGGDQMNQIPTTARLIVDCRILPESTADDVMEEIRQLLGPSRFQPSQGPDGEELQPELTIENLISRESCYQDPSEPACQEVLSTIRKVVSSRADGSPIITNLIPGGTDLLYYSKHPTRRPVCIGFTPVRMPAGMKFAALFHGTNERIPVDGFKWGVRTLTEVVCDLCSAKLA